MDALYACACLWPVEARTGHCTPQSWSYRWSRANMWCWDWTLDPAQEQQVPSPDSAVLGVTTQSQCYPPPRFRELK